RQPVRGIVRSGFERQRSAWTLKELPLTSEQILDDLRDSKRSPGSMSVGQCPGSAAGAPRLSYKNNSKASFNSSSITMIFFFIKGLKENFSGQTKKILICFLLLKKFEYLLTANFFFVYEYLTLYLQAIAAWSYAQTLSAGGDMGKTGQPA
ncbi:MAG: hypothetical protein R6V54_05580, partial [Desulfobacteraceae bacterium]